MVVVLVLGGTRRERQRRLEQLPPEQRGRSGHGVVDHLGGDVVGGVAAQVPVGVGEDLPALGGDPHVAVGERGAGMSGERGVQSLELVGVPAVVLVGERDQRRLGRDQAQRALEVGVEAEPLRRSRDDEARVVADRPLEAREGLLARAVVADQADPVGPGLVADRVELADQPLEAGLVGGHADRDQRMLGGARPPARGARRARGAPSRARAIPGRPTTRATSAGPVGARPGSGRTPTRAARRRCRAGERRRRARSSAPRRMRRPPSRGGPARVPSRRIAVPPPTSTRAGSGRRRAPGIGVSLLSARACAWLSAGQCRAPRRGSRRTRHPHPAVAGITHRSGGQMPATRRAAPKWQGSATAAGADPCHVMGPAGTAACSRVFPGATTAKIRLGR